MQTIMAIARAKHQEFVCTQRLLQQINSIWIIVDHQHAVPDHIVPGLHIFRLQSVRLLMRL